MTLLGVGLSQTANAEMLYAEGFDNATGGTLALNNYHWFGIFGNDTKGFSTTNTAFNGVAASAGNGGTPGFIYTKPGTGSVVFNVLHGVKFSDTAEVGETPLEVLQQDAVFSWAQNPNTVGMLPQLALRIGTDWYVGANTLPTAAGVWTQNSIALSSVTSWHALTISTTDGGQLSVASEATTLPAVNILGAGIYCTNPGASMDTFRFDDFTVAGTVVSVPEPSTVALLLGAFGFLALARRKR